MRDKSIDTAKGIAIVLMIATHCALFDDVVKGVIGSFNMPLFFILSGFFYNRNESLLHVLYKSFKTLVVPYIITAILVCVVFLAFGSRSFGECLENIIFAHGGPKNTIMFPTTSYLGALWFLMALFWCRFYYSIIYRILRGNDILSAVVSFSISWLAIWIGKSIINLPFGLLTGASAMGFYSIGPLFRKKVISDKVIFALIAIWLFSVLLGKAGLAMVNFDYYFYPLNFLSAIGGSYLFMSRDFKSKYRNLASI